MDLRIPACAWPAAGAGRMNTGSVIWCPLLTGEFLGAWEGTAFPGSARREVSADSRLQ